jgi:hypothetical protein
MASVIWTGSSSFGLMTEQLIDARPRERQILVPRSAQESDVTVSHLLDALQASIEATKGHRPGHTENVAKLPTRKREDCDGTASKTSAARSRAGLVAGHPDHG